MEAALTVELHERRLLDSTVGAQALALARRIDQGSDSLTGVAAASRQLEALRLAWGGALSTEPDPIDILRARREAMMRERAESTGTDA